MSDFAVEAFLMLGALRGPSLLALLVSAVYFAFAGGTAPLWVRALSSLWPLAAVAACYAWMLALRNSVDQSLILFVLVQLVPAVLLILAVRAYPGRRGVHYALVPIGIAAWVWAAVRAWGMTFGE